MTTKAGTNLEADEQVAPECNFLHTLWSQCDLFLNGTLVTQFNNSYPYRAYIESLLSFGKEAKDSQLSSILWYRNTARHFDERDDANLGYAKRKELAANKRKEQYKKGCALFAFDLTPQLNSSDEVFELIQNGNIRLELHFAEATPHTLTVIVFAGHDNLLEIDRERHVAFDYTARILIRLSITKIL